MSRLTYRVYRRIDGHTRKFVGILAVPIDVQRPVLTAFEMAKELYGNDPDHDGSDYEVEVQGID